MERITPAVAVKVAVVALAGTVTTAGKVRTLVIAPEMLTEAPPVGAALVRTTVHVVLALEAKVAVLHCSEEIGETSREILTDTEAP